MKKFVSLLVILVFCISLACPVLADEFVPSISAKDAPEIVTILDDEGNPAIGEILDENGNVVDYLYEECLLVTPVSQAKSSTLIPDDAEALLLEKYNNLVSGKETLPYEKFNANLDPSTMVIRDLYDVTWLCGEGSEYEDHPDHPEVVAPKGVVIRITFDLGVSKNANVYTMSFKNGAWNPIVKTVNNGDGTVTCTFEDFCPVAMSVGSSYVTPPSQTGDDGLLWLWIGLLAVATLALVALVVVPVVLKKRNVR